MPDFATLLHAASDLAPTLLVLTLKVAVLLGVGWGLARLMRRASAAWRHAVWAGALGAALAVTVLPLALPTWDLAVLPGGGAPLVAETATPVVSTPMAGVPRAAEVAPSAVPAPPVAPAIPATNAPTLVDLVLAHPLGALVAVWALGVLAVGTWWLVTAIAAWRLAVRATPVKEGTWLALLAEVADDLGLRTPVRLLQSERLSVPVTWGAVGPVLIVPVEAEGWDADRRRAVLAHELAHVRRRDVLWQWVAQLACALHWYQPLAWVAYRRLLAEREHACDDAVLRAGTRPSAYADVLLGVARSVRRREPVAALAMAPMARRSQLEGRLLSILDPSLDRRALSRVLLTVLGAVTLLLAASLATVRPVPAQAAAGDGSVAYVVAFEEARAGGPTYSDEARRDDASGLNDRDQDNARDRDANDGIQATPRPAGLAVPGAGERAAVVIPLDEDFRWDGVLTPGQRLIVNNINGEIKARGVDSDRVVVEAEKKDGWRGRGNSDDVEIEVVEFRDGVAVCVRYEGQRGECGPNSSPQGDMDSEVNVSFSIQVPRGVHFEGASVNGAVEAIRLSGDVTVTSVNGAVKASTSGGDVVATTVNGAVEATASGSVQARTVNGAIRADMGRADWSGTAEYSTVNGAINLTLPADFSAEVEATTGSGGIRSDFPLRIKEGRYVGAEASGTIGSGGRQMKLSTQNGSISLRRSRASLHRSADPRDAEFRATATDTRRAAERSAQAQRTHRHVHVHNGTHVHQDVQAYHDSQVEVHVNERGMRLTVDGEVEVDLDWRDLTNDALDAVEEALEGVDWDDIADEVEDALREVDPDMHIDFGQATPPYGNVPLTRGSSTESPLTPAGAMRIA